ncbi:hypothetical protein [Butyrivibrio sp. FC2001]|uniref:hypothetical protein n=1 Tax=Butyrivibrio sp. FC2001 TaxID=1280671 RepID=UPI0003F5FE12|nr:hypothetical protein [Butyrivibrio sp. FC2001]
MNRVRRAISIFLLICAMAAGCGSPGKSTITGKYVDKNGNTIEFSADGKIEEIAHDGSTGLGTWEKNGDGTYKVQIDKILVMTGTMYVDGEDISIDIAGKTYNYTKEK